MFGKLPAHGDFVARGLAAGERDALDGWLAGSLAAARAALGEAFEATYDEAPPWRFAARDADGWQAGAMAPSVDAVGRRYPILVGVGGVDDAAVAATADAVETLLYTALGEGWDADRLHVAARAIAAEPGDRWTGGECWWTLGGGSATGSVFVEDRLSGARPTGLMRAVLTMRTDGQEKAA